MVFLQDYVPFQDDNYNKDSFFNLIVYFCLSNLYIPPMISPDIESAF